MVPWCEMLSGLYLPLKLLEFLDIDLFCIRWPELGAAGKAHS